MTSGWKAILIIVPVTLLIVIVVVAAASAGKGAVATSATTSAVSAAIGTRVIAGNWAYTVTRVEHPGKTVTWSSYGNKADANGTWLAVLYTVENLTTSSQWLLGEPEVVSSAGLRYKPDSVTSYLFADFRATTLDKSNVPPRIPIDTALLYDIAPAAQELRFCLPNSKTCITLD